MPPGLACMQGGKTYFFQDHGLANAGCGGNVAVDPARHEAGVADLPVVRPCMHRLNSQYHPSAPVGCAGLPLARQAKMLYSYPNAVRNMSAWPLHAGS